MDLSFDNFKTFQKFFELDEFKKEGIRTLFPNSLSKYPDLLKEIERCQQDLADELGLGKDNDYDEFVFRFDDTIAIIQVIMYNQNKEFEYTDPKDISKKNPLI